jgi:hypothetical protein
MFKALVTDIATVMKRSQVMKENYPLYTMVGMAMAASIYVPIRHLTKDTDITAYPEDRGDIFQERRNYYNYFGGLMAVIPKIYGDVGSYNPE